MIPLVNNANVDTSDPTNYPDGRIKDNTGPGNGTPVNRNVYGDLHSNISKMMRLYGIAPNQFPDNETNGYQIIEAIVALASKNDFIIPITTDGTDLSVDIKLNLLKVNESFVCIAGSDKGAETSIKGSTPFTFLVSYSGNFKANEYVRLIKTSSGISLIRLADWISLSSMASELGFLKKASQAQEDAGISDAVATTPLVNKTTFTKRVIGSDSSTYLASASNNGLMSIAQFNQLASSVNNVKNSGWFSGLDVGGSNGNLPVSGNITVANVVSSAPDSTVTVTMQNAMSNTNYKVNITIESQGNINFDNDISREVFRPISQTQFLIAIRESVSSVQNLKFHLEVVQL